MSKVKFKCHKCGNMLPSILDGWGVRNFKSCPNCKNSYKLCSRCGIPVIYDEFQEYPYKCYGCGRVN